MDPFNPFFVIVIDLDGNTLFNGTMGSVPAKGDIVGIAENRYRVVSVTWHLAPARFNAHVTLTVSS